LNEAVVPDQVAERQPALLFELDGTLVESVYQQVLPWRAAGRQLDVPS
jgi:hypothetical protein